MRVVALFRVSTEKQASEGASLDAQQRTYREMASKAGWETVEEFRGCESATQAASDRRVLQQVLACIRDKEPDAVYVHEQSRLTRGDELEVAVLMRELKERRIKIIVHGTVRDLESIDERFMVGIQSLVDRAESERIKERLMRGKRERARQGRKNSGPAPFGYRNPPPGARGRGTLEIVETEAVVVRKIFELAASQVPLRAIATRLNELGMPAPRAAKWGRSGVMAIVRNVTYTGVQATGVWKAKPGTKHFTLDLNRPNAIVVADAHPAIVERSVWESIHGRPKIPCAKEPRMLTGLLYVRDTRYGGDSDGGKRAYRSPRGMKGLPWLDAQTVDDAVWRGFVSLATGPEFVETLMTQSRTPEQLEIVKMEIEHLTTQLRRQRSRLARLVDMRADGEIDREQYAVKSGEAQVAIAGMEVELTAQRAKAAALDVDCASRIVQAVQTLLAGRTRLTTAQKSAIMRTVVKRIDLDVEETGKKFARDDAGRILGSGGATWVITKVSFRLALPAVEELSRNATLAPTLAPDGEDDEGGTGVRLGEPVPQTPNGGGEFRPGQCATTSRCCVPVAGTADTRSCQCAIATSCWARPAPEKP